MTAERFWKAIAAPKEINGSCLAVVLSEDAAIGTLGGSEFIPGDGCFGDYLLPTELIGIPLRQGGSFMGVLHNRQLERARFGVGEKFAGRTNWKKDRREM